jgi:two-component sensor histidine kinase
MATTTRQASSSKPSHAAPRQAMHLSIAGGPRAPERARAWLQSTVGWLPDELEHNLLLLTCELVNNSVLHGKAGEKDVIEIELRSTDGGVRAQVSDPGHGFMPTGRDQDIDEPGGWGLVLVDRLAKRAGASSAASAPASGSSWREH